MCSVSRAAAPCQTKVLRYCWFRLCGCLSSSYFQCTEACFVTWLISLSIVVNHSIMIIIYSERNQSIRSFNVNVYYISLHSKSSQFALQSRLSIDRLTSLGCASETRLWCPSGGIGPAWCCWGVCFWRCQSITWEIESWLTFLILNSSTSCYLFYFQ